MTIHYANASLKDEAVIQKFENANRNYFISLIILAGAVVLIGLLCSILLQTWAFLAFSGLFLAMTYLLAYDRIEKLKKNQVLIIPATCIEKERSGYRRQYHDFIFTIDDDNEDSGNVVKVQSTFKNKFVVKGQYILSFFVPGSENLSVESITPSDYITKV